MNKIPRQAAGRAVQRNLQTATQKANLANIPNRNRTVYNGATHKPVPSNERTQSPANPPALRIIPLGGLGEVGKNFNILEYGNDALVLDAGFILGVDLPGINYAIPELEYLEKIKHKIRGYVFTHGHLDHIGAMPFAMPIAPAPCYGTQLTLGMLERVLQERAAAAAQLDKRVLNPDNHDRVAVGPFMVELVRVTHSIADATAAVIDTPVGRIVHTGDFRIDPNPLDGKLFDTERFKQIGQEGVLLLMSDSTNCERMGRTETESVIEPTISELITKAPGRTIISAVSTNINRIQMIINAAIKSGRKVAIDGRSMLANLELAVKLGYVKIPRGTVVAMRDLGRLPDRELAIISTGHQGELNSVLMRMASGEHKHIKFKPSDTVILSASPIPGNEKSVVQVVDRIMREGVKVYQHVMRELDGIGTLHVSGHASRDELTEMIELTRPKFFMPIHGEFHHQVRHAELAMEMGFRSSHIMVADNGDVLELMPELFRKNGRVPAGALLVDQSGAMVPGVVIKDRLLMAEEGIVVVMLTVNRAAGELMTSPDIITRGFIYMRENEELMQNLRNQVRHFTVRRVRKVELDRFKQELKDDVTQFLFSRLQRTPIVIPVVNMVDPGRGKPQKPQRPQKP